MDWVISWFFSQKISKEGDFIRFSKRVTLKFIISISIFVLMTVIVIVGLDFLLKSNLLDSSEVLKQISAETLIEDNEVKVSQDALTTLVKENSWLQILNEEGKEIYSYQKPATIQNSYAPGELVAYRKAGIISDYKIYTWFHKNNSQKITWIYGIHNTNYTFRGFWFWIVIAFLCLVLLLVIAFLFGVHLGKPILYLLVWIENIAKGIYKEPINKKGVPVFEDGINNQYRKKFKEYEELICAIKSLSYNLQENEKRREQLENSREEWIAGVSHDMKTPLSSVKGYANLMALEHYNFNREETQSYAKIICDKASYMEDLIEDLNLTSAINNNVLPINLQIKNLVELVRRVVINLINDGTANHADINFLNEEEKILYPVDEKWFIRAIENLLYNAVYHNDDKVKITISINQVPSHQAIAPVMITITDNGKGMTKEQLELIFERYYRGTNTSEDKIKGSGLGTAIAKQLIEANGGQIEVKSKINQGTTFIISLPGKN